MKSVAVILGSAFHFESLPFRMRELQVDTPFGMQQLFAIEDIERPAYVIFRHGLPHRLLPNQINYRAQAIALSQVKCGGLLVSSSVGVMNPNIPLYTPLLVDDILMPENRLPDGSTCTMFVEPSSENAHLVLKEGLLSKALGEQIARLGAGKTAGSQVIFVYAGGPRGKTAAENAYWAQAGGTVNSMTLAPEIVLANELGIPCSAVVVGHKYSVPGKANPDTTGVTESLENSRLATIRMVEQFIKKATPVEFGNVLYRFK